MSSLNYILGSLVLVDFIQPCSLRGHSLLAGKHFDDFDAEFRLDLN